MNTISTIKYMFTVIGLCMLTGAYFLYINTQDFLSIALKTEGQVIELYRSSDVYKPVVEFSTQDGDTIVFTSSSGSSPPSYEVGERVEVLYQQSRPSKAQIDSFFSLWGAVTIVGGLGCAFFLVGFGIILRGKLNLNKVKYLKANGIKIKAKYEGVVINESLEVNGKSPFQIQAQWQNPVTSEVHLFNSENIWFDPTEHVNTDTLTVLIEKDNPKKYHVDVSFLPDLAK